MAKPFFYLLIYVIYPYHSGDRFFTPHFIANRLKNDYILCPDIAKRLNFDYII
ncbi:hypothetical protein [Symbiopectobacterium purcellii]|uniref:hypothetical protein n=1 Tax=Symbiopectobacterium purcellii TaxID=2871826 RepID=UPI003F871FB3